MLTRVTGPNDPNPLSPLAKQFGMQTYATDESSLQRYKFSGVAYTDQEDTASNQVFKQNLSAQQSAAAIAENKGDTDISLQQAFINVNSSWYNTDDAQYHLSSNLEFDYGSSADQISAQVLTNSCFFIHFRKFTY